MLHEGEELHAQGDLIGHDVPELVVVDPGSHGVAAVRADDDQVAERRPVTRGGEPGGPPVLVVKELRQIIDQTQRHPEVPGHSGPQEAVADGDRDVAALGVEDDGLVGSDGVAHG